MAEFLCDEIFDVFTLVLMRLTSSGSSMHVWLNVLVYFVLVYLLNIIVLHKRTTSHDLYVFHMNNIYVYVYVYVCTCVCVSVLMCAHASGLRGGGPPLPKRSLSCVGDWSVGSTLTVCMYMCKHTCMYVCTYVYTYICMYVHCVHVN